MEQNTKNGESRTRELATQLVDSYCSSWPAARRAELVEALVADYESDPLKDLPATFGRAARARELELLTSLGCAPADSAAAIQAGGVA